MHSENLALLRQRLIDHPLYDAVQTLPQLRVFQREHAFAVWDFMSLLKRLQQIVSGSTLPWLPPADPQATRFVQEIVLGEECDDDGRGGYASHFTLYLQAMQELTADTEPIDALVTAVQRGTTWSAALQSAAPLPTTAAFVTDTLRLVEHGTPSEIAAAFFYGREDVIPEMFTRLVRTLTAKGIPCERLLHYLRRHIELDGDQHGPQAERLLDRFIAGDPRERERAEQAACRALRSRLALWDGILAALPPR